MSKKLFDISDLLAIWKLDALPKASQFNKLHVESNPILTEVYNMTRTVPVVVDVKRMAQKYVGIDLKNWWGWSLEQLFGEGVKSFMNFIHPDDLIIHEQINHLLLQLLEKCHYDEKSDIRVIFNYRYQKSNGSYIHLSQLTRILEMDEDGHIDTFLVLLHEINLFSSFPKCYIRLFGVINQEKLYEYCPLTQEIVELGLPTPREKEIIGLLIVGQDSQRIAEELFISKHTVDTHRRRILQKFHLKNTHELMQLVSLTRLLDSY